MSNKVQMIVKKNRVKPETKLAIEVASYIKKKYNRLIYRFDLASDLPMPIQEASRLKMRYKHRTGYPDLFIPYPATINKISYSGLYVELKAHTPFRKDGALRKQKKVRHGKTIGDHLQDQSEVILELRRMNYAACFAWGDDDHAIKLIDRYMSHVKPKHMKKMKPKKLKFTLQHNDQF